MYTCADPRGTGDIDIEVFCAPVVTLGVSVTPISKCYVTLVLIPGVPVTLTSQVKRTPMLTLGVTGDMGIKAHVHLC
jgi:hypothetical protein